MAVWENIQKSPRCHTHRGLFYFIHQAAKVLPVGDYDRDSGASLPKYSYCPYYPRNHVLFRLYNPLHPPSGYR